MPKKKEKKSELIEQLYRCRSSYSALEAKNECLDEKINDLKKSNSNKNVIINIMLVVFAVFMLYLHTDVL